MPRARTIPAAQRRALLATILYIVQCAALAISLYASQWYWKQPYHNSALTGADWVEELIYGHPERIRSCLGMRVHVFMALLAELHLCGLKDSRHVTVKEKVAIFLYTCVTGLATAVLSPWEARKTWLPLADDGAKLSNPSKWTQPALRKGCAAGCLAT